MPDVRSTAPVDVRLWEAVQVHTLSIVATLPPPKGNSPRMTGNER
jgi:hypothetical protein